MTTVHTFEIVPSARKIIRQTQRGKRDQSLLIVPQKHVTQHLHIVYLPQQAHHVQILLDMSVRSLFEPLHHLVVLSDLLQRAAFSLDLRLVQVYTAVQIV